VRTLGEGNELQYCPTTKGNGFASGKDDFEEPLQHSRTLKNSFPSQKFLGQESLNL
jgi:hypothetical protein